ncbi:MAG: conjugal transfer protein TraR [Candidatus Moranbacteria bacterium CG10_big_fil_rev_8_21_14_0_10_35_21]|nr:MAG: conjugal transfer protein TraR [Candidatus Moranbacteria bacterium CG10_big_fil_rev_8_21_14_0_10_35_21]PJA88746.1 MAG: conjugal transfer protein TraR [Candidatus Moranbacteria bacterium CG_4_9_14_3_um_filter_36_9]
MLIWIVVFVIAMLVMVKGADWFLAGAEKIGLAAGLSPFVVGVIIVGMGTSFPELISSIVATLKNVPEIVVANAVGSNISNILLIIGISAIISKRLTVSKNLINLDLPILATATVLLLGAAWDRHIGFGEALILVISYIIYLLYTVFHKDERKIEDDYVILPSREERRKSLNLDKKNGIERPKLQFKDFALLIVGVAGLLLGAKYLIDAVIKLSELFNINPGIISITAVAIGTSLPELLVSVKAAFSGKSEIAVGNIFGSNAFNALVVVGVPGLIHNLPIDEQTFLIGLPTMAVATLLFIISGISQKIYIWEGAMYLMLFIMFIGKLFNLL